MKRIALVLCFAAGSMLAQPPVFGPGNGNGAAPGQLPANAFADVKAYLGLTDAQVTQLTQLLTQQRTAAQTLMDQIRTKEQALQTQLSQGSTNAAALGQLLIDIQALRKQVSGLQDTYRAQAVATLTADQKTKLAALDAAAKLQPTIHEANMLNLLAPAAGTGGGVGGRGFGPAPMMAPMRMMRGR